MNKKELIFALAQRIEKSGGRCYYVGGYVRDKLMGIECKDTDIEVHGIHPHLLEEILEGLGKRLEYGKSFGIYSLEGYDLDIALPRSETAIGQGHRDFKIDVDPFIGEKKAAQRRDFTVNALMENVLTGELLDFYGGKEDLERKTLRHIHDEHFAEDPLRVLRAAQFVARFQFEIASETLELCKRMDISSLSKERVLEELKKAMLKAEKPSVFFEILRQMDQLTVFFPEVEALIGIPQNRKYHLEGDVYTHTMMVVDEAAKLRTEAKKAFPFMLSALVHDFGKVLALQIDENGIAHAFDHEKLGLPAVESFCKRLTNEQYLEKYLLNMTRLHMKPNAMIANGSSVKSTNRMFNDAMVPEDLILLSYADSKGMLSPFPYQSHIEQLRERLKIYYAYLDRPYVTGKDLISAGLEPNENFSALLNYAHLLRLSGVEKSIALKQTLAYARTNYRMLLKK